jgi:hypothetical protein
MDADKLIDMLSTAPRRRLYVRPYRYHLLFYLAYTPEISEADSYCRRSSRRGSVRPLRYLSGGFR